MAQLQSTSLTGTFTTTGNVGIGTTGVSEYRLNVNGNVNVIGTLSATTVNMGGNTVLTTANYSSYALPLTGGTMNGVIILNDSSYLRGSPTYGFRFNSNADTINALVVNNSGNVTAYADFRAPIFYDSGDTSYYLDPNSTVSGLFRGSVGLNNTSPINSAWGNASTTTQLSIYGTGYGLINLRGDNGGTARTYSMGVGDQQFYMCYDNTASRHNITVSSAGAVTIAVDVRSPIYYDSNNTAYYLDPAGSTSLNIAGKIVTAISSGTMISHGSMTDAVGYNGSYGTYIGSAVGGTYYIYANGNFYDNGTVRTLLHTGNYNSYSPTLTGGGASGTWGISITGTAAGETLATVTGRGASTSTDLTFNGTLTMGTGGTQYIRMGRFPASITNTGEAWIGRASDRNAGTMTVQLGGNSASSRSFEVVDYAWSNVLFNVSSGGDVTAYNSFRAPIFYDSNDTGYYLDPAGNSNIYNLNIQGGSNNAPNDATLYISATSNNDWGIALSKNGYEYGMYYNLASSHSYGIRGLAASSEYWRVGTDLMYHNASMRSPIFYDSDNTSYYANPAGLSVFSSLKLINNVNNNPRWDFSCYVVEAQHWYGNNSSMTMYMGESGNTIQIPGSGGIRPTIMYDYNDTGYYLDPASTSNLYLANFGDNSSGDQGIGIRYGNSSGGYGRIRFYQSGTNHMTIHAFSANWQGGTFTGQSSGAINFDGQNGVTFGPWNSVAGWVASGGNAWFRGYIEAYGDMYLGDGSSGRIRLTTYNNRNFQVIGTGGTDVGIVGIRSGGGFGFQVYGEGTNYGFLNGTWAAWDMRKNNGGPLYLNNQSTYYYDDDVTYVYRVYGTADMRSPIYYDLDDTGYYLDPASTSNLNVAKAVYFCGNSGNAYGQYKGYDNNNHFIVIRGSVSGTTSALTLTGAHQTTLVEYAEANDTTGWFFKTAATGNYDLVSRITRSYSYFESSVRSPLFYDQNDTAYYLDPNSTSRLYTVSSFYLKNNYSVSTDHTYGIYFSNDMDVGYAIYRESGGWGSPFPDLRISFHTGIKLGANASYNGIRFYDDYTMVTQVMSVNNTSDGLGANNVYVNNSLVAGSSLRAPIFYDSNNTSYYGDFAGTSSMYRVDLSYLYSYDWVYAQGDIIAYYSDERLKTKVGNIENALDKIKQLNGFYYINNDLAKSFGYKEEKTQVGLSAQEVQAVLPEVVTLAPFDTEFDENQRPIGSKSGEDYLTVDYSKIVPLLVEAIKEQQKQIDELKARLG